MAVSDASRVDVHITFVEKDGPFIKIFGQINKQEACYVERLLYQLTSMVFEGPPGLELKPKLLTDLEVGTICCAKFEDGTYYRAKVINIDNIRRNVVTVVFIDHGNAANVSVTDIRLFPKLLQLFEKNNKETITSLRELPSQAHEFYIIGIAPKAKEWDEETLEYLRKRYCNTDLPCEIHVAEGKKFIRMVSPSDDIANLLATLGKGQQIPFQTQERLLKKISETGGHQMLPQFITSIPPPTMLMQRPPPRLPQVNQLPPVKVESEVMCGALPVPRVNKTMGVPIRRSGPPPGMTLRKPEVGVGLLQTTSVSSTMPVQNQLSSEPLKIGGSFRVNISSVESGPHCFGVQIKDTVNTLLTQMMLEINNIEDPVPINGPLMPGSICLGRFQRDNVLCRAIVMQVIDDSAKLYFADFGNSETVPYKDIYQLPAEFVRYKVMCHRFTLSNIQGVQYTERENKCFEKLVLNLENSIIIKVTPPEESPIKEYCDLFINLKNVKTLMKEMMEGDNDSGPHFTLVSCPFKGSQEKVFVSYVISPARFFVQLDKNSYSLNQVMRAVAAHCSTAPPLARVRVGTPCCALYEDGKWYRAEITNIDDYSSNTVVINFVDYGNQEQMDIDKLREISPELVTGTKSQAIPCCLRGYEMSTQTDDEVSNRLEELILEQKLMMHVVGSQEDKNILIVSLLDDRGQDIGTLLQAKPSKSPIYDNYQAAPAAASYKAPPQHTPAPANDGWEDTAQPVTNERKYSDSRAPSDEGRKTWRSREDGEQPPRFNKEGGGSRWNDQAGSKPERRFNKDGEDKPWNKEGRFSREDNRSGRFNRDEEGGSRFNQDDNRPPRFNRDNDSGGRFNRDEDSGGRFNRDDGKRFSDRGSRFNEDDKGGRFNSGESRGGRFGEDRGNRFNKEDGGRFNKTDDDKPWRKRDDDSGGWKPKDRGDGSSSWKDRESSGGWKPSGGGGDDGGKPRYGGSDTFKRGGGFNHDSSNATSFRKPWERGAVDEKSSTKSPKPDTVGGMPPSTVKVGVSEDTQVVFTTSPLEFYVQRVSTFEELNQLMERIATACETETASNMSDVPEKAGCLAKYSEDDTWYRAVVRETSFDSVKVLFVDYGNLENVTMDKIKELPEDMATLPVQAIKCRLYGVPEGGDTAAFTALVDGRNLKTQFVAKNFISNSFEVVLTDEESGTNINTAMGATEEAVQSVSSKLGATTWPGPAWFPAGATLTTQMTWYQNPAQFYLQPLVSHPEFRAMMQSLQTLVRSGTALQNSQLNVGDYVIARFKTDKVLYRALVKEAGYAPSVQFVDYGNTEAVDSGAVWVMVPEYATLPPQALPCGLAGVAPAAEDWPQVNKTELDAQFEAETLECVVVTEASEEGCYQVRLTANGTDVANNIIQMGFAVPTSDGAGELDATLLIGQTLPVALVRVDEDLTFWVTPAAEISELQVLGEEGIRCALTCVSDTATDEQRAQLTQLATSTPLIVLVDAVQTSGLQVTLYDAEGLLFPLQQSERGSVAKVCDLPVLLSRQRVFLAHAGDEGIFLHRAPLADVLPDLLQRLYDCYNASSSEDHSWAQDELCCALSSDEQWYRARIITTEGEVKVQYIDYGNSEVVDVSNLRKLEPMFYTPHALALKVNFHVSWTVPTENLLEHTQDQEYNAIILRGIDGWVAELVDKSGQSLTEKLVELGFATELENSPFKRFVEGGRFVAGSTIPVSVTHVDSPSQIWIFVGNDIELIEALQDRLQEAAPKLPPLKELNGNFAMMWDGSWYRAVKESDESVRFIDYGNSDSIDMTNIKALSPDFLEPSEGYAVKVELPIEFKEGATERLEQLLISSEINPEEEMVAHILCVKESHIIADIIKGGKSVVDTLVEEDLGTRFQMKQMISGFVSHFNSLSDFYIQEAGCEDSLTTMSGLMATAESFESVEPKENEILAALFPDDETWYRAKVVKIHAEGIDVLFIDYGNSATSAVFRALPAEVAATLALSKHCALHLPEGINQWSSSANDKFLEMSADGCTQFNIQVKSEGDPAIVELTCNDESVVDQLRPFCGAVDVNVDAVPDVAPVDLSEYDKIIYISHVNDPNNFYAQIDGAETELDAIKEELSDVSSFEKLEQITDDLKEKFIGALFVDDNEWYRAKIIQIQEDGSEVIFVDYGNSAVATTFVKLPESLETKPALAIHCALGKEEWPEEAKNYFSELSGEGTIPFYMKVLEESEPNIVCLISENKIIREELDRFRILNEVAEETETTSVPAAISKSPEDQNLIKTVFLIQVNSPSDFFLHTAEGTQQIEEIAQNLAAAGDFSSIEDVSIMKGSIVAAQFDEDDLWYRAKILDHSETETKVLFIDYGNTANVARVKNLPDDLMKIPPLAMHCSLQLLGGTEWSAQACETFNKLANNDGMSFDLKVISEGEPNVVILYTNGESVAEQLNIASGIRTEETTPLPNETELDDLEIAMTTPLPNETERDGLEVAMTTPLPSETEQDGLEIAMTIPLPIETEQDDLETIKSRVENSEDVEPELFVDDNTSRGISNQTVEISHFNNSSDFYVQFCDDSEELSTISEDLLKGDEFEDITDSESLVAAKYTVDETWYRAKIINKGDVEGSMVLFVDYGNSEIANELKQLPKPLSEKKPLAKHCCLKSSTDKWSTSVEEKLSALANVGSGLTFEMKILRDGDPCLVDLFVEGRSISETFQEEERVKEQIELGEMILQSVEGQIANDTNEEMQKVANDIIVQATSTSNKPSSFEEASSEGQEADEAKLCSEVENKEDRDLGEKELGNEQIGEMILQSAQDQITKDTNAEMQKITDAIISQATSPREDNREAEESKKHSDIENQSEAEVSPTKSNISNGIVSESPENESNEINDNITKSIAGVNSDPHQETMKTVCNGSPTAPRRSNIDAHIVPGCVTNVKPEFSDEL